jgi:hypothetical protein
VELETVKTLIALFVLLIFQPFILIAPPPLPEKESSLPEPPPTPSPESKHIVKSGEVISWDDIEVSKYDFLKYNVSVTTLFLVYDDSRDSKMLISELNRKWSDYEDLSICDELIDNLAVKELVLIDLKDIKSLNKYRIKNQPEKYPAYRFGVAGEIQSIPKTAFSCTTWPIYTLDALANKNSDRSRVWTLKVEKVKSLYNNKLHSYSKRFIEVNNLNVNEYTTKVCSNCSLEIKKCRCQSYWGSWGRKFITAKLKTHYRYWPPVAVYPKKPETRMPWEYVNE